VTILALTHLLDGKPSENEIAIKLEEENGKLK